MPEALRKFWLKRKTLKVADEVLVYIDNVVVTPVLSFLHFVDLIVDLHVRN